MNETLIVLVQSQRPLAPEPLLQFREFLVFSIIPSDREAEHTPIISITETLHGKVPEVRGEDGLSLELARTHDPAVTDVIALQCLCSCHMVLCVRVDCVCVCV